MAMNKSSMMKFPLVIIETSFTIIFVLCTDVEMFSILYIYEKSTSELFSYFEHLLNEKSKGVNSCVKKRNKNCGSRVVGYRRFSLSESLLNNCHTTVLTRMRMISPKDINYVFVELNPLQKPLRKMNGFNSTKT